MADNVTIKSQNVKEGDSRYCWVNIEIGGIRVGKARIEKLGGCVFVPLVGEKGF